MNQKENNCDPCLREEIKINAIVYCYDCLEKLCEECKRHHKKSKVLSDHELIEVKDGCVVEMDFAELKYFRTLSRCPKHSLEDVKYICKDHDQLCCNECAIVTHRKCEDLVSLADEVNGNQEEKGESKMQKRLEVIGDNTDKLIQHEIKYKSDLIIKENETKSRLKELKADLDDTYNKLENKILSKISKRKVDLVKASSLQKMSAEKLKNDIKRSVEKLKTASGSATVTHVFLLKREMGVAIKEYEEAFKELRQQSSKTLLTIAETSPVHKAVKVIRGVFKIEETMTGSHPPVLTTERDFRDRKMTLKMEFSLMDVQPRYCLWIENCVIVAFEDGSKINAYSTDDGLLLSSYQCPSPTTLAAIENAEFAVTLSNRINIMKIENNQLSNVRVLVYSWSDLIAYNRRDKQLLAMLRSEGVIRKFTLDGKEAGIISLSVVEKNVLGCAFNLFFDNEYKRLHISSHYHHKLLCIDMCGKLVFQYGIQYPWSVITDTEGNVYVASYSGHCIQQLSPDGKLLREILSVDTNVRYPMSMSLNNQMDKMVITCHTSSKNMNIYQFI